MHKHLIGKNFYSAMPEKIRQGEKFKEILKNKILKAFHLCFFFWTENEFGKSYCM
jgi:hypothetical protein